MKRTLPLLIFCISILFTNAQNIQGVVKDSKDGETIIGANVVIKGTKNGTATDFDGKFSLQHNGDFPIILEVSYLGYQTLDLDLDGPQSNLKISMKPDANMLEEVDLVEQRLSEQQQKSALTVEAMDALAIKETPAVSFYEGLGNLKGVDLTSASIGFKIVNTRGFNSTSPVRSLQIIDGVDNQAPGLNFALGNFLGASELDVLNVDIIAGASSAFYGPNAFNGVISMTTKNPYDWRGLSASVKFGERNLQEYAVRWAQAFDREDGSRGFAYKLNFFYLKADDWEATNYVAADNSEMKEGNPGRYDAVNTYGDEFTSRNGDWRSSESREYMPGLEKFYRRGYNEEDIVDYNTENLKLNLGLYYTFRNDIQLSYNSFFGTGTTVYQGENRFSLKDILFFQNVLEIKKENKWFVRAYATNEDAGKSYDAVVTSFRMNELSANDADWNNAYFNAWRKEYVDKVKGLPGYPVRGPGEDLDDWANGPYLDFINDNQDSLTVWHGQALSDVNTYSYPRIDEGTAQFDSVKGHITNTLFTQGGSKFYDKSALYHIHGEYKFDWSFGEVIVGGNGRMYRPDSKGTIFDEMELSNERYDPIIGDIVYDTTFVQITNVEYGMYLGYNKGFMDERLRVNASARVDKNQNFDFLVSPAASMIYELDQNNTFRLSFSSAIRNPTLQDQYLNYDAGRATLLGNLEGYDSLITIESFEASIDNNSRDYLDYFNVDPIRPEKVRTIEVGYRAIAFNKLFLDANYFYSYYTDFIGYKFGLDAEYINDFIPVPSSVEAYRISANTKDAVSTQGFSLGFNYYINDKLSFNGNYTYNKLDKRGSSDPIIPAFNTPENKFNLGLTGKDYFFKDNKKGKAGFAINLKWVEGFLFEGSPQFTGQIPSYYSLDAQVNYQIIPWKTTIKLGASNLTNNSQFQVYGGPYVGRLMYISVLTSIL